MGSNCSYFRPYGLWHVCNKRSTGGRPLSLPLQGGAIPPFTLPQHTQKKTTTQHSSSTHCLLPSVLLLTKLRRNNTHTSLNGHNYNGHNSRQLHALGHNYNGHNSRQLHAMDTTSLPYSHACDYSAVTHLMHTSPEWMQHLPRPPFNSRHHRLVRSHCTHYFSPEHMTVCLH